MRGDKIKPCSRPSLLMGKSNGSKHIRFMSHPLCPHAEVALFFWLNLILYDCRLCCSAQVSLGHPIGDLDDFQSALNHVQNTQIGDNAVHH